VRNKVRIVRKKVAITFLIFHSVAETSFHRVMVWMSCRFGLQQN